MRAALPILLLLAGCASLPEPEQAEPVQQPAPPPPDTRRGAYYKDDGPGERSAAELAAVPGIVGTAGIPPRQLTGAQEVVLRPFNFCRFCT